MRNISAFILILVMVVGIALQLSLPIVAQGPAQNIWVGFTTNYGYDASGDSFTSHEVGGGIPLQVKNKFTGLLSHGIEGTAYAIRLLLGNPEYAK